MKTTILLILALFFLSSATFSQSHSTRYTMSAQKIYNKLSGEQISDDEFKKLIETNPNIVLEPVINKYGAVESFKVDPNRKDKIITYDVTQRVKIGEPFPPFVMKSINNKKLDLEKLKGKTVLIQFQLEFGLPFFKENTLQQFSDIVSTYNKSNQIEAIVISQSTKQEIKDAIEQKDYKAEFVPNGRNFNQRYLVVHFPTVILLDKSGILVGYYTQKDISKLRSDIESLL